MVSNRLPAAELPELKGGLAGVRNLAVKEAHRPNAVHLDGLGRGDGDGRLGVFELKYVTHKVSLLLADRPEEEGVGPSLFSVRAQ